MLTNDELNKNRDILEQNNGEKVDLDNAQNKTNENFKDSRTTLSERQATLEEVAKKAVEFNESLNGIKKHVNDIS